MDDCFGCSPNWGPLLRDQSKPRSSGVEWYTVSVLWCSRFDGDPQWSETGDRYLLKLFRDYLFHQVLPSGAPWVDLSHIVQSLNKVLLVPATQSLHSISTPSSSSWMPGWLRTSCCTPEMNRAFSLSPMPTSSLVLTPHSHS